MSASTLTRARRSGHPSIDPRLTARRIEVARARGRKRLRRLLVLAAITVLVLGAVAVTRSSLLDVDQVTVSGASNSGESAVLDAADIAAGEAMVSVDLAAVEARIGDLPWVADASVTRSWPGTVRIEVVEREPVAVAGEGADAVVVDSEGRILGSALGRSNLPSVGSEALGEPGSFLSEDRREVVAVVTDLPPELTAEVAAADLVGESPVLELTDGIVVHLGDGTRLRSKSDAALALLEQADRATIASIDVSVPSAAALTRHDEGDA